MSAECPACGGVRLIFPDSTHAECESCGRWFDPDEVVVE